MFWRKQNTTSATGRASLEKPHKFLLGLGGLAMAGLLAGAAPAMAYDRIDFHGRDVVKHEIRDRHEGNEVRTWVSNRYEALTHVGHVRKLREAVVVEAPCRSLMD